MIILIYVVQIGTWLHTSTSCFSIMTVLHEFLSRHLLQYA